MEKKNEIKVFQELRKNLKKKIALASTVAIAGTAAACSTKALDSDKFSMNNESYSDSIDDIKTTEFTGEKKISEKPYTAGTTIATTVTTGTTTRKIVDATVATTVTTTNKPVDTTKVTKVTKTTKTTSKVTEPPVTDAQVTELPVETKPQSKYDIDNLPPLTANNINDRELFDAYIIQFMAECGIHYGLGGGINYQYKQQYYSSNFMPEAALLILYSNLDYVSDETLDYYLGDFSKEELARMSSIICPLLSLYADDYDVICNYNDYCIDKSLASQINKYNSYVKLIREGNIESYLTWANDSTNEQMFNFDINGKNCFIYNYEYEMLLAGFNISSTKSFFEKIWDNYYAELNETLLTTNDYLYNRIHSKIKVK